MSAVDDEERQHFQNVLASFRAYEDNALFSIRRSVRYYAELSPAHQALAGELPAKFAAMTACVQANARFLAEIAAPQQLFVNTAELTASEQVAALAEQVPEREVDKVRSVLKQFVREWSAEGAAERATSLQPLVDALCRLFAPSPSVRVLVPGCGLGRLVYDVARAGYSVQGNEYSYHMLLASSLILNRTTRVGQYVVHPFVHQTTNVRSVADQLRAVHVPDVLPVSAHPDCEFSMCAGEFVEVFREQPGEFSCVLTCFFVDTGHNVIDYVQTIYDVLRPGGAWVNLGPLLYHFADMDDQSSIELTYDEVMSVVRAVGFLVSEEREYTTPYTSNVRSLYNIVYTSKFFVCIKPADARTAMEPSSSDDDDGDVL